MSLISAVQTYLLTYTSLASGAPVWVNHLNEQPTAYSIVPQPGARKLEEYINGGSMRDFPFAFQINDATEDDAKRLNNIAFGEALADWFESQTKAGTLPTLAAGKTSYLIEATLWPFLFEQGQSGTGIYQISCRLVYEQTA